MPRLAQAALAVIVAHAAVLAFLGRTPPGPLLSNLAMVVVGTLAACSGLRAAARGRGFSRTVFRLLAVSLGLWTAAQVSWTVTENVFRAQVPEPSLTHLLFRFSGAPLIMALLLDEEGLVASTPDWARVLDFAQIGILFLFFYFDLYFVPPAPGASLASLQVAGFLDISDIENWLIAAGFLLRTFLTRNPAARLLLGRVSLYVVGYAVASTTYNYGYYLQVARTGEWFDVPWTMALGLAAFVSSTWQPREEPRRISVAEASAMRVVTVNWVSALAPVAVMALALQVAAYERTLAFIAAFASVLVFGARMLVERYRWVQAVEALRASEERYARLVELSPEAIAVFVEGRITYANPAAARLAGVKSASGLVGRPVDTFVTPDTRLATRAQMESFPQGSPPIELDVRRLDGSKLRVEAVFIPLAPPSKHAPEEGGAGLVVARDVTERRRAESEREALIRELEARNAELERFSYTVSHDLKSPLVTIRGFLGLVEQAAERGDTAAVRADMSRIYRASERMERLLNELLDLSRVGRVAGPAEAVDLDAVVREALANARQPLEHRGIAVEIAADLPVVFGDRLRLVEVAQNLVDNAARFMGDEPRPKIVVGSRGCGPDGQVVLFVSDNGIGIPPRFHDQVFRLFEKLDPASSGTGVGLALVKRIVEVHGGRVWVESGGERRGTTFCFTLPLAPPGTPPPAPEARP
jgi:PAS domain S-box-containing protein